MKSSNKLSRRSPGRTGFSAALLFGLLALTGTAGCDEYGGLYDFSAGLWDWGFLPDAGIIQSVNDYRQDVFDAANDAWDAYIRGE